MLLLLTTIKLNIVVRIVFCNRLSMYLDSKIWVLFFFGKCVCRIHAFCRQWFWSPSLSQPSAILFVRTEQRAVYITYICAQIRKPHTLGTHETKKYIFFPIYCIQINISVPRTSVCFLKSHIFHAGVTSWCCFARFWTSPDVQRRIRLGEPPPGRGFQTAPGGALRHLPEPDQETAADAQEDGDRHGMGCARTAPLLRQKTGFFMWFPVLRSCFHFSKGIGDRYVQAHESVSGSEDYGGNQEGDQFGSPPSGQLHRQNTGTSAMCPGFGVFCQDWRNHTLVFTVAFKWAIYGSYWPKFSATIFVCSAPQRGTRWSHTF